MNPRPLVVLPERKLFSPRSVAWILVLLVALTFGAVAPAQACFSSAFDLIDPPPPPETPLSERLTAHVPRSVWEERVVESTKAAAGAWNGEAETNLAVAQAQTGNLAEAFRRLKEVERIEPGRYGAASNLGTIYELRGDNENALKWIIEGIRRSPKSLEGTEWLHARILVAKICQKKDPRWLAQHSVLGLDFGNGTVPKLTSPMPQDNLGQTVDAAKLEKALEYQLHERLQFVMRPDPIVADLLVDIANTTLYRNGNRVGNTAARIYELAMEYEPARPSLVARRLNYYNGAPNYPLMVTVWGIAAVGIYAAWRYLSMRFADQLTPVEHTIPEDWTGPSPTYGVSDRKKGGH